MSSDTTDKPGESCMNKDPCPTKKSDQYTYYGIATIVILALFMRSCFSARNEYISIKEQLKESKGNPVYPLDQQPYPRLLMLDEQIQSQLDRRDDSDEQQPDQ